MELSIILFFSFCICVNSQASPNSFTDVEGYAVAVSHPEKFVFQTKCYKFLGCFYNGKPFYDEVYRPFSPVPDEVKNANFPLFTPSNPTTGYNLTLKRGSVQNSPIKCNLPLKVILHGFLGDYNAFLEMKDSLLIQSDYNVIVPDYQLYTVPPYFQAAANTRTIGARCAAIIKRVLKYCSSQSDAISASDVHLIGHSLGAQISGYIGKIINNIGRISGLDPASPSFEHLADETHLVSTDANFVDVTHTNILEPPKNGVGFKASLGDLDFIANDGTNQPGCNVGENVISSTGSVNYTEMFNKGSCSHSRSVMLYIDSIKSTCQYKAVHCKSYYDFSNGKCPPNTSVVATPLFFSKPIPNLPQNSIFFFRTKSKAPFCLQNGDQPAPKWKLFG